MNYLFRNYELYNILNSKIQDMKRKIDEENPDYFINVNFDEYLAYICNEFKLTTPTIDEENITINKQVQKVERYNDFYTSIRYVDGVALWVLIPYIGNKDLFLARPSAYTTEFPQAGINNEYIVIELGLSMQEVEEYNVKELIQHELKLIHMYLGYIQKDLEKYNKRLKDEATEYIKYKIENSNKINNMLTSLPYKLIKNENAQLTYKVPNVERKIQFQKPKINKKNITPEPELETQKYNEIIEICSNMAKVMERSPKAFANMGEEDLRTHFLVQLNGQYEGQATGKTFNSNGKTDILIRNDNQNVFIAECKFWKGKKGFLATIDQLLGYVTYRDTKTAIFVFVKNKDFTKVCEDIKSVTAEHSNFVKYIDSYKTPKDTSAFRCEFKNKNDEEKHFYITVMAFCIPHI